MRMLIQKDEERCFFVATVREERIVDIIFSEICFEKKNNIKRGKREKI